MVFDLVLVELARDLKLVGHVPDGDVHAVVVGAGVRAVGVVTDSATAGERQRADQRGEERNTVASDHGAESLGGCDDARSVTTACPRPWRAGRARGSPRGSRADVAGPCWPCDESRS